MEFQLASMDASVEVTRSGLDEKSDNLRDVEANHHLTTTATAITATTAIIIATSATPPRPPFSSFPIFVPLHHHLPRSRAGQAQGAGEKGRKIAGADPVGDPDGERGQAGDRPLVRVGPPLLDPLPSARRSRWGGVQPLSKDYEVAPSVTWRATAAYLTLI